MKIKKTDFFFILCLLAGWIGEQLFWGQYLGINFPLFTLLAIGLGYAMTRQMGREADRSNLWTLLPIAFFATMVFVRKEPLTTFLNFSATLIFLALFAHGFLGRAWWGYGFQKFIRQGVLFIFSVLIFPLKALIDNNKDEKIERGKPWQKVGPYVKGLLFALPLVLFFTMLLAAADPIFEEKADLFFDWLVIDDPFILFVQGMFILILSWGLAGAFLIALNKAKDKESNEDEEKAPESKLGFIESNIMLGSVNLLFLTFVFIQFRYFFGAESNINLAGYTYAEYARRGFGELVMVAGFSLLLFMGLSAIAARENKKQLWIFSGQGIALLSLVSIILVSAMQRLQLYETVYGFTRLRTYTHVFIIWLGLYLVTVVVLEVLRKQNIFAMALVVAGVGFLITLNVLNVDGFIVRKNVQHLDTITFSADDFDSSRSSRSASSTLDIDYLSRLSTDALPALARSLDQADEQETRDYLAGAIYCYDTLQAHSQSTEDRDWRSFHLSQWIADNTMQGLLANQLAVYEESVVIADGEVSIAGIRMCDGYYWD